MEVSINEELIKKITYTTETHKYSVTETKLKNLKENGKLLTHIKRGLRLLGDNADGDNWEESWHAIFDKINE